MQSLVKKLKLKRVVAMLLLVCTVMSTFLTSFSNIGVVKADSNDLRKTYIQMMAGRNASQIEGISDLTTDDLRALALYLSNFYVPFSTTLDSDSEDDNKEVMIDALTLLGIKKEVAEPMISGIYSASLSSAQKLYVKESDLWAISGQDYIGWGGTAMAEQFFHYTTITFKTDKYKNLVGDSVTVGSDTYVPLTAGLWQSICRFLGEKNEAGRASTTGGKDACPLFYIDDSNNAKECFNLNYTTMMLLAKYLDASKVDTNGKAMNALLNMDGYSSWDKLNDNERGSLTLFFENIYVDWVGNIIYDAGDQRIVIYPACMNPFVWTAIEGESDSQYKRFNAVSTWGIWLINNSKNYEDCGYTTEDSVGNVYADDNQVVKLYGRHYESSIKQFRGSSDLATFDSTWGFWGTGEAGTIGDWIKKDSGFATNGNKDLGGSPANSICYWGSPGTIRGSFDFTRFLTYDSSKTMDTTSNSQFIEGNLVSKSYEDKFFTTSSKFSTGEELNSFMTFGSVDKEMLSNIFITYAFCYANKGETSFDKTKNYINFKFNEEVFPKVDSSAIEWGTVSTIDDQLKSYVNFLLNPVEGAKYVATLLRNKLTAILIDGHEHIVGGTDSNVSTGMTRYLGFSGYATTPSLSDVSWLDSLLKFYNSIIVYFIIFMCLLLLCYVLTGQLTLQRSIIGVVIFGLLAFAPPLAINTTVDISNKVASQIYSNKFEYWALVQMEQYLGDLKSKIEAADSGNTNDYIAQLMNIESNSVSSSISYTGTKLKWMTPKKYNDLNEVKTEIDNSNVGSTFSSAFTNLMINSIANSTSSENYSESVGQTYLYRDMCDIYLYGMESYHMYKGYWSESDSLLQYDSARISSTVNDTSTNNKTNFIGTLTGTKNLVDSFKNIQTSNNNLYLYLAVNEQKLSNNVNSTAGVAIADTSSLNAIDRGFLYDTVDVKNNGTSINYFMSNTLATTYLVTYRNTYMDINNNLSKLQNIVEGTSTVDITSTNMRNGSILFGLDTSIFDMSINDISNGGSNLNTLTTKSLDKLSGYYYSLYCESPYYFFNWNIRDQFKASGLESFNKSNLAQSAGDGKFSKMLLRNNQEYFFNLAENSGDGYGELRDFMNFHDLFYYVIPALKDGNDLVDMFDQLFGMYAYDDCSLTLSADGKWHYNNQEFKDAADFVDNVLDENDIDEDGDKTEKLWNAMTEEQRYKFWHDYNVWTIFNNYVTWLDTMQDCNYTKSETISVMGDKFVVSNPLDPTSYYQTDDRGNMTAGRYMVFSESEMKYYGLSTADLTTVEQKIISIQKSVYNTSLDLMNYYTLSDETLINAFSLIELFEFNKEFSQESIVGQDYILYPQGYELKAFTYDAYLRLIVSEASGESLMSDSEDTSSIYQRVAKNTSLFFGIFLVLNDLVAVYIVPMLKLFIICLLFLTSLLIIIGAAVKLEFNFFNVLWKSLLAPLLSYAGLSLGLAFVVSMFMSNGTEGVVSSTPVISLGDPTMALICMLVLNVFFTFMYFKIVKKCISDFKTYFQAVANSIGSAVTGVVGGTIRGALASKFRRPTVTTVASTARQRGIDNNPRNGKYGLGTSAFAGVGAGLGMSALSKEQQRSIENARDRADASLGMNKYNKKVYANANARIDKQQAKYDAINHKAEIAKNSNMSEYKKNKLEQARRRQELKLNRAKGYADDIAKKGVLRANAKRIGSAPARVSGSLGKTIGRVQAFNTNVNSNVTRFGGAVKSLGSSDGRKQLGSRFTSSMKKGTGSLKTSASHVKGNFQAGRNEYSKRYTDSDARGRAEYYRTIAIASKKQKQRQAKQNKYAK